MCQKYFLSGKAKLYYFHLTKYIWPYQLLHATESFFFWSGPWR